MKLVGVRIEFEPRDIWVGLFWKKPNENELWWYICLIPCFPIIVRFLRY